MIRGSLRTVLDAIDGGALTVMEVSAATHLPQDVVRAALDTLQATGRLSTESLSGGCPPAGCGSCAVADDCVTGPVLIGLSRRAG